MDADYIIDPQEFVSHAEELKHPLVTDNATMPDDQHESSWFRAGYNRGVVDVLEIYRDMISEHVEQEIGDIKEDIQEVRDTIEESDEEPPEEAEEMLDRMERKVESMERQMDLLEQAREEVEDDEPE